MSRLMTEQQFAGNQIEHYLTILKYSDGAIRPNFFLIGGTGSGKTHTIRACVQKLGLEYIEVNAAAITREGHSGNSISKALGPLKFCQHKPTVVFVDEFDKTILGSSGYAHDSTADLQYEFLKLLEDGHVSIFADYGKYVETSVSKCLFIFGGTFNGAEISSLDGLTQFGIRTEFLGRVGQLVTTSPVSLESLLDMVEEHKLTNSYLELFNIEKQVAVAGIQEILINAFDDSDIGVRLLDSSIHNFFLNLDQAPTPPKNKKAVQNNPSAKFHRKFQ